MNLRGEFHVENVTSFEDLGLKPRDIAGEMDIDDKDSKAGQTGAGGQDVSTTSGDDAASDVKPQNADAKADKQTTEADTLKNDIDYDQFYPIFWSLQEHFSNPPRLFDVNNLQRLKDGLELTLNNFKALHKEANGQASLRLLEESKRGVKRKRGDGDDYMASNFNPKYLTSRELFELEVRCGHQDQAQSVVLTRL